MIPAFGSLLPSRGPASQPQADLAIDLLRAHGELERAYGRTTAFRFPDACACGTTGSAWREVEDALAARAIGLVTPTTFEGAVPGGFELIVVDDQSRLLYAGPPELGRLCGPSVSPVALLPGLLVSASEPFVSTDTCQC